MKNFFLKHKRPVFLTVIILVLTFIFTTAAVTEPKKSSEDIIKDISTCSKPEGRIVTHGIDISFYQGNVDFQKVKDSGISFVILRAGITGFGSDDRFEEYYEKATAVGLDVGCYYYTYSTSVEGVQKDAEELLSIINGKTFTYPVFLDFEEEAAMSADMIDENTAMVNAFCSAVKKKGYYPGVYTSASIYENYLETISLGSEWDFWIASYDDHTCESDKYSSEFSMWQYSNQGSIDGIDSDVDLNVAYVDFPKLINEFRQKLVKYTTD